MATDKEVTMPRLLTAEQVRDRFGVRNVATVYRWAASGKLRRVVLSARSIRFRPEDVEAFITEHLDDEPPRPEDVEAFTIHHQDGRTTTETRPA
jgi:predicted DNA-binding transcriptional regulator AlpA